MNRILETTKFVIEHSDQVKINYERLFEFANNFDHGSAKHWLEESPFDFSHFSNNEKLQFVILFNALSFCYWGDPKWTVEYKDKKHDGAWGMILALGRGIDEGAPLLNFEYCSNISKKDFGHILRGNIEIPLFEERWKILQDVRKIMLEKFGGIASNLLTEADYDTQVLLQILEKNFVSFRDTSEYQGATIYFQKRAQLLIADIFQIFDGKSFGALKNIDQITACADYKLPQILRKLSILEYSNALSHKIDTQQELLHDSPEEIEIRANTIWAIEYITKQVQKQNPNICAFQVNDHLWLATQEKFENDKPYHRTRTTAY